MENKTIIVLLFSLVLCGSPCLSNAQSQTSQETLDQYVVDIQKTPEDNALREKIIKLAQGMKPLPAIPAEAEKFSDRAEYAAKTAKTETDFADAAKEYEKALLIAPWIADYYFNLAVMQEKANQPQKAANSFTLYLSAEPDSKDSREVRKRIAGLEYAAERAAKESMPKAVAATKQDEGESWLKNLDGARFIGPPQPNGAIGYEGITIYDVYYIEGNKVHTGWFDREPADFKTASIRQVPFNDKSLSVDIRGKNFVVPHLSFENRDYTATISDDGQFITFDTGISAVYKRVK